MQLKLSELLALVKGRIKEALLCLSSSAEPKRKSTRERGRERHLKQSSLQQQSTGFWEMWSCFQKHDCPWCDLKVDDYLSHYLICQYKAQYIFQRYTNVQINVAQTLTEMNNCVSVCVWVRTPGTAGWCTGQPEPVAKSRLALWSWTPGRGTRAWRWSRRSSGPTRGRCYPETGGGVASLMWKVRERQRIKWYCNIQNSLKMSLVWDQISF